MHYCQSFWVLFIWKLSVADFSSLGHIVDAAFLAKRSDLRPGQAAAGTDKL